MILRATFFLVGALVSSSFAFPQASPGPYEILPFEDGFIIEAWRDLLTGSQIVDWSGNLTTTWESPNAYNGHTGTDFSLQTGTPLYAAAPGSVVTVVSSVPENTNPSGYGYGNYVEIAVDGLSPLGEQLNVVTAHMLPNVQVSVGQRVTTGQLLGYSDNTGNSTSEHLHLEPRLRGAGDPYICPFYYGLFKYPIMFNPAGTHQVGRVIQITAATTPVRQQRLETSAAITTVYRDQKFFCSYWQRGYYRVFIPNDSGNRSGWVKATDAREVFEGTVIQALPDAGAYVHTTTLLNPYQMRSEPTDAGAILGRVVYGGGRFVADQVQNGWYRIPLPGSATWGWVKADARMVVYPHLYNPSIDLNVRLKDEFPIRESFSVLGKSMFGRPKFNRSVVKDFTPASPGGDGKAIFVTDATNAGDGVCESVMVGKVNHRNYFVQCDVYFNYQPQANGYGRYGIFIRDDGFAGLDQTFEGKGNAYALLFDSDDGRLRAARLVNSAITDFLPTARYITSSGWHTMRIEAKEDNIRYYLDGDLLIEVTDNTFPSGPCGIGFSNRFTNWPADRGAYFDNFLADTLEHKDTTQLWEVH